MKIEIRSNELVERTKDCKWIAFAKSWDEVLAKGYNFKYVDWERKTVCFFKDGYFELFREVQE